VILGWPDRWTTVLMGLLIVIYTSIGGNKAVIWADVQQMMLISCALVLALFMAIHLMPADVSWAKAISLAGAAGRLNAVTTHFDWDDRYNVWSGLIGGMFLALAYFGCDQSQVQRYLTGKSIAQSRLGLLFNALAKIPMQFFILFIGAMVFVFFTFEKPPLLFQPVELARLAKDPRFPAVEQRYDQAFAQRKQAAEDYLQARDRESQQNTRARYQNAQHELDSAHAAGEQLVSKDFHDTNYIFLSFVTGYLPVGVVGLIVAVIFTAAMSSTSGEINSLAAVSVIDIYQRHFRKDASDGHYLAASRVATVFWGIYAVIFAQYGSNFGALIEAVNIIGSLFYGGLLGVFVLAFFFKSVGASGAFFGVLAGEAAIFAAFFFTKISFLWYNVIGCLVMIAVGVLVSRFSSRDQPRVTMP